MSTVIVFCVVGGLALLLGLVYVRPDWWYLFTSSFHKKAMAMGETGEVLWESYSIEELKEMQQVTWNQSLMLINTEYMLDESFVSETGEYQDSGVTMNTCIMDAYRRLAAQVYQKYGNKLYISSAYRDREKQAWLYAEDPQTATVPGASERESGLCLDVYVKNYSGDGFLRSPEGQFVNSNCHKFGFIIRYPHYGEDNTGIRFEPWHIRYVGEPHATYIYNNSLTLEEYISGLEEGVCYDTEEYYVTRQLEVDGKIAVPAACDSYIISPDNTGSYIITGKKTVR